jgi:hypothetical protein
MVMYVRVYAWILWWMEAPPIAVCRRRGSKANYVVLVEVSSQSIGVDTYVCMELPK